MHNVGMIFIPRSIRDHWLWEDDRKFKRWCDLIMEAAWTRSKFRFGNVKGWLERGQQATSVRTLMHRWKTSTRYVTEFLNDLESENLITIEAMTTHTIITIVDYDIYQGSQSIEEGDPSESPPSEHLRKRIEQRDGSQSKEDNNINNNSSLSLEEQNSKFVELIKNDDGLLKEARLTLGCGNEEILVLLEVFMHDSNFKSKRYPDFDAFKGHFINWSREYIRKEQAYGKRKSPKTREGNSTNRLDSRRGHNAEDHKAEDYDGAF